MTARTSRKVDERGGEKASAETLKAYSAKLESRTA